MAREVRCKGTGLTDRHTTTTVTLAAHARRGLMNVIYTNSGQLQMYVHNGAWSDVIHFTLPARASVMSENLEKCFSFTLSRKK